MSLIMSDLTFEQNQTNRARPSWSNENNTLYVNYSAQSTNIMQSFLLTTRHGFKANFKYDNN